MKPSSPSPGVGLVSCGRLVSRLRLPLVVLACCSCLVSASDTFPNPRTHPAECRSDNSTARLCDPDGILTLAERQAVQQEITIYEAQNITCQDEVVDIQIGVALMRTMKASFGTNLATAARNKATAIHGEWGVGYQTPCGGTGLLVFLAIDDHQIYMSRGKALNDILSDDRLTYIVGKMKPNLRDGKYGEGLELGVQLLTDYIMGDRPGFDETLEAITTLLGIAGVFLGCCGCMACIDLCRRYRERQQREELRSTLSKLDRDRARALQGKYKATSCPICLEDFKKKKPKNGESQPLVGSGGDGDHVEDLLGSDGGPVNILSCGHAFDKSCWDDFSSHPSLGQSTEGGLRCPICREPADDVPSNAPRGPIADGAYQDERRFRLERLQEMYPTFIGTQYIDQWYDPSYRGSLLHDFSTIEQEQRDAAERARAERNRMFSYDETDESVPDDFGGGKADGGGVGDSWSH